MSAFRRAGGMYAPPALVAESCASVDRNASPLAAVSLALASCSRASRAREALTLALEPSSLLEDAERSLLDLLLLDLGGGDLDRDEERDEVLGIEAERVAGRFRLRAASTSGDGDLEGSLMMLERLSVERSRDGIMRVQATLVDRKPSTERSQCPRTALGLGAAANQDSLRASRHDTGWMKTLRCEKSRMKRRCRGGAVGKGPMRLSPINSEMECVSRHNGAKSATAHMQCSSCFCAFPLTRNSSTTAHAPCSENSCYSTF